MYADTHPMTPDTHCTAPLAKYFIIQYFFLLSFLVLEKSRFRAVWL
jgi:hypothetical protein